MIELRETSDGVILPVKVAAGSRSQGVRGLQNGMLKLAVTVAPEKGKANKAVIKLVARRLKVPDSAVQIIAGHTSSQKQILVSGLDAEKVRQLLQIEPQ